MCNINDLTTEELINELLKRKAADRVKAGPYCDYSLKKRYAKNRDEITAEILILRP